MANPPAVLAMQIMAPIAYAPQVIPAPAVLADGTTLYPGETTGLITDPTVAAIGIPADSTTVTGLPAGTHGHGLEDASPFLHHHL